MNNGIRKNLATIGFVLSIAATVSSIFAYKTNNGIIICLALFLSLSSYALCGGIVYAIKAVWGVAKFGWFVIPIFPFDLITGALGFVAGLYLFAFAPVFFVGRKFFDIKKQETVQ